MTMFKPKIIVTRKLPNNVENFLKSNFIVKLNNNDKNLSSLELKESLKNFDGILCCVSDIFDKNVFSQSNFKTSIISNFGVGVSNINLELAKKKKIVVTNTPDVLTEATSNIAIFLILSVSRRTTYSEKFLREGNWKGFSIIDNLGLDLIGKNLGIVGMGRIGKATAQKAYHAFGMNIKFFNRSKINSLNFPAKQIRTLEELIKDTDVLSIHVPGGNSQPLIQKKHFDIMKKNFILINTSRGEVIDEVSLLKALKEKKIFGAGLDVFCNEPKINKEIFNVPNLTILPHIGSATKKTREKMGMIASKNLLAHFTNKRYVSRIC